MTRNKVNVDELLRNSLPSASRDQGESACARVLRHLQSGSADAVTGAVVDFGPTHTFGWRRIAATAVAASVVILAIGVGFGSRNHRVYAEPAEGLLFRISEGNTDYFRAGERIEAGEIVHTNDYSSAAFTLPDGSRVEMRSKSELSLEAGKDGVLIRLNKGAVVVDAASRPAGGRLSVQTNDATVSALAAGFLINIERSGTRVAAIRGVIRVEQGDRVTTLQPGEQTATTPSMSPVSLAEELGWSRNSSTYMDQLKQIAGIDPALFPQNETTPIQRSEASVNPIQHQPAGVVHTEEQDRRGGRVSPQTSDELDAIRGIGLSDRRRSDPPVFVDPWAEGKRILDRSCSGCHSTDFVYRQILAGRTQQRYASRGEYEALIAAENARGAGVSESETAQLVDWLSGFSGFK